MRDKNSKAKELTDKINASIDELANLTDEAKFSEAMQAYLETMAKFHNYSFFNQMLIAIQHKGATKVAGYKAWQKKFSRHVRKGEKSIRILAPILVTDKEATEADGEPVKTCVGFRPVSVFDVSQTDGEDLPDTPNWKSPEKVQELTGKLIAFAEANGIKVTESELVNGAQGVSKGGEIVLAPEAGTKTLVHEIAHELLHQIEDEDGVKVTFKMSRKEKELEAESIAFVVGTHFGINDLASPNYLALWGVSADEIKEACERIRNCSAKIIKGAS